MTATEANNMITGEGKSEKGGKRSRPLKAWRKAWVLAPMLLLTFVLAGCDTGDDNSSSSASPTQGSSFQPSTPECSVSTSTRDCINSSGVKVDTSQWNQDQKDQQQQQADQTSQQQNAQQAQQQQADDQARRQAQQEADDQARRDADDQARRQADDQARQQARSNQSY